MANKEQNLNSVEAKTVDVEQLKAEKSPTEKRSKRLGEINRDLNYFNNDNTENIEEIETKRNEEFESKMQEMGKAEIPMSEDTKKLIYQNMVSDSIDHAKKENERLSSLQKERRTLTLYNNLNLGESAQKQIRKAEESIKFQDETGEKMRIFNEAIGYYSKSKEKIADVPIYHGGGAFALKRIIEEGSLDSIKNVLGGEFLARSETHGGTSFALGKYEEAEVIGRVYARKAEKNSSLVIDSNDFLGTEIGQGRSIIDAISHQLPKLKMEERSFVEEELRKVDRDEMINFYKSKDFVFNFNKACEELRESKEKIGGKRGEITDKKYLDYLKKRIPELKKQVESFNKLNAEEKELSKNPFGIMLVYEGKGLPEKDLETFTTAGISERRTKEPISNSQLKQLYVPQSKISQIKDWLEKKAKNLPQDSEERKALEKVKIIPMEYLEIKNLIQKI